MGAHRRAPGLRSAITSVRWTRGHDGLQAEWGSAWSNPCRDNSPRNDAARARYAATARIVLVRPHRPDEAVRDDPADGRPLTGGPGRRHRGSGRDRTRARGRRDRHVLPDPLGNRSPVARRSRGQVAHHRRLLRRGRPAQPRAAALHGDRHLAAAADDVQRVRDQSPMRCISRHPRADPRSSLSDRRAEIHAIRCLRPRARAAPRDRAP